jgi:hypothetical protein
MEKSAHGARVEISSRSPRRVTTKDDELRDHLPSELLRDLGNRAFEKLLAERQNNMVRGPKPSSGSFLTQRQAVKETTLGHQIEKVQSEIEELSEEPWEIPVSHGLEGLEVLLHIIELITHCLPLLIPASIASTLSILLLLGGASKERRNAAKFKGIKLGLLAALLYSPPPPGRWYPLKASVLEDFIRTNTDLKREWLSQALYWGGEQAFEAMSEGVKTAVDTLNGAMRLAETAAVAQVHKLKKEETERIPQDKINIMINNAQGWACRYTANELIKRIRAIQYELTHP